MAIQYPNGKIYTPNKNSLKTIKKDYTFSNRGKTLEDELNDANEYYLVHEIAVIYKKPIPIQVVKVDYPSRSGAVIKEASIVPPLQRTLMEFIKVNILTLRQKKRKIKQPFL